MLLAFCLATAAVALLLLAAATDFAARIVSNRLCLTLSVIGIALQVNTNATLHTLVVSFLAGIMVFVPAAVCWRHGIMGGGDVKLLGAAALVVRPDAVLGLLLAIALSGSLLGIAYWLLGRLLPAGSFNRPKGVIWRIFRIEHYRIRHHFSVPYAVAISSGTIFVLGREVMT